MERQARQLASALKGQNCQIFFVTCAYWSWMRLRGLAVKGTVSDFTVYRVPIFRGWPRLNAVLYGGGALWLLVLLRSRYSIIHAHELHSSGVIACFCKLLMTSKRVIIKDPAPGKSIGDLANLRRLPASRFLFSLIRRQADTLVGVTREVRQELEAASFTRVRVIPNGVDTARFGPLDSEDRRQLKAELLGNLRHLPVVLFVGRLGPEKNLSVLLESVKSLKIKVLLLIVGDGILRPELERVSRESRSDQRVVFWGTADRVERFFQIADAFALPSLTEGFPNALLEAMSCGVPSIGSDIPGIRVMIKDGVNGYLFRQDARELGDKLNRIFADQGLRNRFSRAARKTIVERFSIHTIAREYRRLYGVSDAHGVRPSQ